MIKVVYIYIYTLIQAYLFYNIAFDLYQHITYINYIIEYNMYNINSAHT